MAEAINAELWRRARATGPESFGDVFSRHGPTRPWVGLHRSRGVGVGDVVVRPHDRIEELEAGILVSPTVLRAMTFMARGRRRPRRS